VAINGVVVGVDCDMAKEANFAAGVMAISLTWFEETDNPPSRAVSQAITEILEEHDLSSNLQVNFAVHGELLEDSPVLVSTKVIKSVVMEIDVLELLKPMLVHLQNFFAGGEEIDRVDIG
jgi:hypothetical protein